MVGRTHKAAFMLGASVIALVSLAWCSGPTRAGMLDPEQPPSPTMRPLDQMETRIPIGQPEPGGFPIVISEPGSYYLVSNITGVSGQDGIHILSDAVTLDLNGFDLIGVPGSRNGITVPLSVTNVFGLTIVNGGIESWGADGICATDPCGHVESARLRHLRAEGNGGRGIAFHSGLIMDSISASNAGIGILAAYRSTVTNCLVQLNGNTGIELEGTGVVSDCNVMFNAVGISTDGYAHIVRNHVEENSGAGIFCALIVGGNRIDSNDLKSNNKGIACQAPGNLVIRNTASGNYTADYDLHPDCAVGQIVDMTSGGTISAGPWANIRY